MTAWWNRLNNRERRLIQISAAVISVLLIYLYLWRPLSTAVTTLHQQIASQRMLLVLMYKMEQRVQRFRQQGMNVLPGKQLPMLSLIESSLSQRQLSRYLVSVKQPQTGQIAITLQAVPFDQCIDWVQSLWQRHAIVVVTMNVKKIKVQGKVDMALVLRRQ